MARLIELKQTAPERFLARFDTGEEMRTTLAVVTDFHLRAGKELTAPELDTLLRRRLRSDTPDRDELRRASDYLYRRGFGRDEIRAAIARYQDNYEEY